MAPSSTCSNQHKRELLGRRKLVTELAMVEGLLPIAGVDCDLVRWATGVFIRHEHQLELADLGFKQLYLSWVLKSLGAHAVIERAFESWRWITLASYRFQTSGLTEGPSFELLQEEQLKKGVREMKQRHLASFMSKIDQELSKKLHEKDLEIESMNQKNRELVDQIRQAASEAQTWQRRSQYNESIVHALRCSLQQAMAHGAGAAANHGREGCGNSEVDDAASSFCPHSVKDGQRQMLKMACKGCKRTESRMLLLPCRHLCLCMNCDAMVDLCPVCFVRKTASVEVYMS